MHLFRALFIGTSLLTLGCADRPAAASNQSAAQAASVPPALEYPASKHGPYLLQVDHSKRAVVHRNEAGKPVLPDTSTTDGILLDDAVANAEDPAALVRVRVGRTWKAGNSNALTPAMILTFQPGKPSNWGRLPMQAVSAEMLLADGTSVTLPAHATLVDADDEGWGVQCALIRPDFSGPNAPKPTVLVEKGRRVVVMMDESLPLPRLAFAETSNR
jgi:hypothetical protein